MSIRPATAGDAAAIALVHVRSWQAAYRGLLPQDYLDSLDPQPRQARWSRLLSQDPAPGLAVLVAEQDGQITGFASTCPARDDDLDLATTGEVSAIYLLREAWGRGLGRELMTGALAVLRAAGFGEAALWVLDSNTRARSFYAAGGWRPDGAVKQDQLTGITLNEVRYLRHLREAQARGAGPASAGSGTTAPG